MSDYLAKETPDPTTARLTEEAEKSKEEEREKDKKPETLDPKKSKKKEGDVLGEDASKQRVITFSELKEEEKKTPAFAARTGERQQEV